MSTLARPDRNSRGFTLIEMMAAMMILAFGVTTVFAVFSTGLATEEMASLVRDSARMVTTVRENLHQDGALGEDGGALPEAVQGATLPQYPGLRYDLAFDADPDRPWELIVHMTVRWLRRGSDVSEVYRFPMARGKPLHMRIAEERGSSDER